MTGVVTACRVCGREFEPASGAIRAGTWQTCPACQATRRTPLRRTASGAVGNCAPVGGRSATRAR